MQDSNTEDKRIQAYNTASNAVKELYGNLDLGEILGSVATQLQLPEQAKKVFINIIGDIILGFYPKSDLKRLLVSSLGITEEIAQGIERDLTPFLARIDGSSSIPEAPKDLRERLVLRPQSAEMPRLVPSEIPAAPSAQKPLTREEVMSALSPRRTMAEDIQSLQEKEEPPMRGYGSIQSGK